jgi:outer membrane beta-barrel protein
MVAMAVLLMLPAHVRAQEGLEEQYHKSIKVFQLKPVLKKNRAQLGLFATACINPESVYDWGWGATVDYHINELFSIGGHFTYFAHFATSYTNLDDEITYELGVNMQRTRLGYAGTLRFGFTPFFGKFSAGKGRRPYWDLSAFLGGGVVHSQLSFVTGAMEVGIGFRFFITPGLAITAELSDLIYWEHFKEDTEALQRWMVRAGISVFLPYTFSYGGKR